MQVQIQKWGNSAGIRIPKAVMEQVGTQVGGILEASVQGHALILKPAKPRYKLSDLLAQCDETAPVVELGAWEDINPVGQEVW